MADSLPRRARRGGRMRFQDASSTASWLRKRGKAKGPALSRQSRSELALCFSMIDEDDNGAIDADELRVAFAALGVDATRAQCVAEIARVDRDRSGTIQLPEFVTLVTSLDASSGRDGAISRTPRRVEAVRRLTAGADADTDARVVLAEAGVGPDGQGMERALADARARVDATGTGEHSRRGAATASDERSSTTRRNAPPPIGLTALAFKRRTSIARVVDVPSRVRALAREDARAASASRRAEAAARAAEKAARRAGTYEASREAFSRGDAFMFTSRGLANQNRLGTHLLESSGDEAEKEDEDEDEVEDEDEDEDDFSSSRCRRVAAPSPETDTETRVKRVGFRKSEEAQETRRPRFAGGLRTASVSSRAFVDSRDRPTARAAAMRAAIARGLFENDDANARNARRQSGNRRARSRRSSAAGDNGTEDKKRFPFPAFRSVFVGAFAGRDADAAASANDALAAKRSVETRPGEIPARDPGARARRAVRAAASAAT